MNLAISLHNGKDVNDVEAIMDILKAHLNEIFQIEGTVKKISIVPGGLIISFSNGNRYVQKLISKQIENVVTEDGL